MKKGLLLLGAVCLMAVGMTATAQGIGAGSSSSGNQVGGATIDFEKEVHDYGTIKQHGDGACEFKFTNNGTEPLIISNARGSCGCTVPSWPKEPIAPGESSVIKVKYDTKRVGPINKSVTITSNAGDSPTTVIRIKGKVEAAPTAPTAPKVGPKAK